MFVVYFFSQKLKNGEKTGLYTEGAQFIGGGGGERNLCKRKKEAMPSMRTRGELCGRDLGPVGA